LNAFFMYFFSSCPYFLRSENQKCLIFSLPLKGNGIQNVGEEQRKRQRAHRVKAAT